MDAEPHDSARVNGSSRVEGAEGETDRGQKDAWTF
jgi:hypothetical protein